MSLKEIVKQATIIDVRTPEEYEEGHVEGAINIPLHEMVDYIEKVKEIESQSSIVFCCKSGGRSEQAFLFFKNQGIECHNGGSWEDANALFV